MAIEYIGTDRAAYAATYQTNEDGSPVPFVSRWRVDAPGVPVAVYEDSTGALLGSGVSSSTPEASGEHAGWYLASVPITSWSSSAGALVPTSAIAVTFTAPSLLAAPPLPASAMVFGFNAPTYTAGDSYAIPTSAVRVMFTAPTISAAPVLPASGMVMGFAAPTISSGGGGSALLSETFDSGLGTFSVIAGAVSVSGGAAPIESGDSIRAPVTISARGFYVEFPLTLAEQAESDGGVLVALSSSATAMQAGEYRFQIVNASYEGSEFGSVAAFKNSAPDVIASNEAVPYSTAQRTVRVEVPSSGSMVVKIGDVTYLTVADSDHSAFSYVWLRGSAGGVGSAAVHGITVGSL